MKYLILFLPFFGFSQQPFDFTNEFFNVMTQDEGGFSIGNACGDVYMEVENYGDLNMNNNDIEILSAKITVFGVVTNLGTITYLCDNSVFELAETLTVPTTDYRPLKVFPNPFKSWVWVQGVEVQTLQLYDVTGRLLKNYKTMGVSHKIYTEDLSAGTYFLVVNNTLKRTIIKQ